MRGVKGGCQSLWRADICPLTVVQTDRHLLVCGGRQGRPADWCRRDDHLWKGKLVRIADTRAGGESTKAHERLLTGSELTVDREGIAATLNILIRAIVDGLARVVCDGRVEMGVVSEHSGEGDAGSG